MLQERLKKMFQKGYRYCIQFAHDDIDPTCPPVTAGLELPTSPFTEKILELILGDSLAGR